VLLTLDDSAISQSPAPRATPTARRCRRRHRRKDQTVTLVNNGSSPADPTGACTSPSLTAALRFPKGRRSRGINAHRRRARSGLVAGEDNPLNKKKDNTDRLYDRLGFLVSGGRVTRHIKNWPNCAVYVSLFDGRRFVLRLALCAVFLLPNQKPR
jgi:hypothetical protein